MEEMNIQAENRENQPADAAVTAELDRRVQEAVDRAREQWQAEAARAEAEQARMAAMTDQQRADYAMTQREQALAEREQRLVERELRAMAMEKLAQRGLPRELAEALCYRSEAECLSSLDALEKAFRSAVQQGVDERLRGATPAAGGVRTADADSLSDAEYYRTVGRM